jgi:hypothetical protein
MHITEIIVIKCAVCNKELAGGIIYNKIRGEYVVDVIPCEKGCTRAQTLIPGITREAPPPPPPPPMRQIVEGLPPTSALEVK